MINISVTGSENVSLALLKEHLKKSASDTSEDNILTAYIAAARAYCEEYCNRAFVTQNITIMLDTFPNREYIELKRYGTSTASLKVYYLDEGVWTEMSSSEYRLDTNCVPCRIILKENESWPDHDNEPQAVKITYTVTVSSIEGQYKSAILLMAAEMDANRENPTRSYRSLAEKLLMSKRIQYYE